MNSISLNMTDELTGEVIERSVDISVAMSNGADCWELKGKDEQKKNIERWIEERGNLQHETILSLNSWVIS